MVRVDSSRAKYAWARGKPWLFGKELPYAAAVTVVGMFISMVVRHHHFGAGLFSYLMTFVASAIIVFVAVAGHAYISHPRKRLAQELDDHLLKHPDSGAAPPSDPTLTISPVPQQISAYLTDAPSVEALKMFHGLIFMTGQFYVSAGPGNQHPITVLHAFGEVWLDDDEPRMLEGDIGFWLDESAADGDSSHKLPVVQPGHTVKISIHFNFRASPRIPGVDPDGKEFHLPGSADIQLRVFDSQNTPYTHAGAFAFSVARSPEVP